MNTFDPKAEADALLASLAAAGNGEEMAVSVRKAAWAAAKAAAGIQLRFEEAALL